MAYVFNQFHWDEGMDSTAIIAALLATYLKLDFSNLPASPVTDGYAANGNTLELWWNGMLVESWTVTPTTPPAGTPLGLLLTLTYS